MIKQISLQNVAFEGYNCVMAKREFTDKGVHVIGIQLHTQYTLVIQLKNSKGENAGPLFCCYLTTEPFHNCQISTLGAVGSLVSAYNNRITNLKTKGEIENCRKGILNALFAFCGKSTLMLDVRTEHEKFVTEFFRNPHEVVKLGAYKNINTLSNLVTLLVR